MACADKAIRGRLLPGAAHLSMIRASFENSKMGSLRSIGIRMMARAARSRHASSVARKFFSPKHTNNLQNKEKIFSQSVALQQTRQRYRGLN